jgi:hypothetical protein
MPPPLRRGGEGHIFFEGRGGGIYFLNETSACVLNIKKVNIYNENTVADGNVLCKRIHSNL